MGKTITEKIISRASGRRDVSPGDIVWARIDLLFTNETVGPRVFERSFEELGGKIWDPERFVVLIDHYNLPSSTQQAEIVMYTLDWTKKKRVKHIHLFCGPEHQVLADEGFILPGAVVIGTDSHTTTAGAFGAFATGIGSTECAIALATGKMWFRVPQSLKFNWNGSLPKAVMAKDMALRMIRKMGHGGANYMACEFAGSTIENLSIDGRMVLANMAIEMGAKNGIINPDKKTLKFVKSRTDLQFAPISSDAEAEYAHEYVFDADNLEPLVACPHEVDHVKSVAEVEGSHIDSVLIGTCAGGRIEDMDAAASILKGRRIHENVYTIILPSSLRVYRDMLASGLVKRFIDAGCVVSHPTCGPCAGTSSGIMAPSEVRISTQNRNFMGRSGGGEIYLASALTCAASAIEGKIADPRRYL